MHVLRVAAAAFTLALLLPSHASAAFHFMMVKEVYAGSASSPNAKYVMLQMYADGQNFTAGHQIVFYDAAGTEITPRVTLSNVTFGANQSTILIATTEAQTFFGVNRDFAMTASSLPAAGGKVCFDPEPFAIDCVAWGNYTGSTTSVGTPFNAAGGIPSGQAMRRRIDRGTPTILDPPDDTTNCATDFTAQSPHPISNAGQQNSAQVYVSAATGNDANAGTTTSPVMTIAKGVSLAAPLSGSREVRVAQGTYGEKITMVEGVSLLGGYQCSVQPCSWNRDTTLYDTAITNTDFEGVLAPITITRATRLDGFRIVGMSGAPSVAPGSAAITIKGSPTIYGNKIFGGDTTGTLAAGQTIAVAIIAPSNTAEGSLIEANQVTAGDSQSVTAGIFFDPGSPSSTSPAEIRNNTIVGGTSTNGSCYGIAAFAAASGTLAKGNDILAGSATAASRESWAISLTATMTIDSNRINVDQANVGTCAGTRWCGGIMVTGTATITNNLVFGSKASRSAAVLLGEFEAPAGTVTLNANYLDGGGTGLAATSSTAVALEIGSCMVCGLNGFVGRIRNNILLGGQNQNRYGIYEDPAAGRTIHPEAVENNDFYFAPLSGRTDALYHSHNGVTPTDHTSFPPDWVMNFSANPLVDGTFHLMAGSPCVDTGTATEAPAMDFDGDVRPQGLAIDVGADEQLPQATALILEAPANASGGVSFNVTVTARDANTNVATGYRGTVHFTSDDGAAVLPMDYPFTAGDAGVHTFSVTLNTAGTRSITAADAAASLSGSDTVVVLAPFGAPTAFSATATSATSVALQWTPVSEATSYEVHRSTSLTTAFVLAATSSSSPTVDGLTVNPNTTYLYKVRAVRPSGMSDFSSVDVTTTTVFTDTNLVGTVIKANHILQLRTAVNAMRTAANQSAVTFTDGSLSGIVIKAEHITQLRTALDAARSALGLTSITYLDSSIVPQVTPVKKDHVLQLRAGTQ